MTDAHLAIDPLTEEGAAQHLRDAWFRENNNQRATWDEQEAQDQAEQEEQDRLAQEEEDSQQALHEKEAELQQPQQQSLIFDQEALRTLARFSLCCRITPGLL
ncbi:hypothetical protein H4582DRAFT_2083157 [Lactarius indigo]|nr:hypothetical protein H4582DRAFT_2083157 [Lactarius indigo]